MHSSGSSVRDESLGALLQRALDDLQQLLEKQIELVKLELREDLHQAIAAAKSFAIGASLLLAALICFFNFLFLAIDRFLPGRWGWLAALVFFALFATLGAVLLLKARKDLKIRPLERSRETLKEDAEWAKHLLKHDERSTPSATTSPQPSTS